MGGSRRNAAAIYPDFPLAQAAVRHPAEAWFDAPWDRHIQHRRLQGPFVAGDLAGDGRADQGNWGGDRHQQGAAMAFEMAGPHPLGAEAMQINAEGGYGTGAAGMAAGQALGRRLVAAAASHHPADGAPHQHG